MGKISLLFAKGWTKTPSDPSILSSKSNVVLLPITHKNNASHAKKMEYCCLALMLSTCLCLSSTLMAMRSLCIENLVLKTELANQARIRGILSVAVVDYVPREMFEKTNFSESEVSNYADPLPDLGMTTFRRVITMWTSADLTICEVIEMAKRLTVELYGRQKKRLLEVTPDSKGPTDSGEEEEEEAFSGKGMESSTERSLLRVAADSLKAEQAAEDPQLIDDAEFEQRLRTIDAATKHLEAKIDQDWKEKGYN